MKLENLMSVLRWRQEVEGGEMIEQLPTLGKGAYTKEYWSNPSGMISQGELDFLCLTANRLWMEVGSRLRIYNCGGEIRPTYS